MKSMFSRLFCSVMFIAAVLGNVVVAKNKNIDDDLAQLLVEYFSCDTYDNECLMDIYNNLDNNTVPNIIQMYEISYKRQPETSKWFYTVAKFVQEKRSENQQYNEKPESPLDEYSEFRMYAEGPSFTDKFCSNLMVNYLGNNAPVLEYTFSDYVSKAKAREIMQKSFGLNRACDLSYGIDNDIYFDVRWDSYEFKRMVDYTMKLIKEIEDEQH